MDKKNRAHCLCIVRHDCHYEAEKARKQELRQHENVVLLEDYR
jgi:hypothetical protein